MGLGKGTLFLFSMKIEAFDEDIDSVGDIDLFRSLDHDSEADNSYAMRNDHSFSPL